jgi:glycerol-3-phosphate dehydrogenase (NAD(P)+)
VTTVSILGSGVMATALAFPLSDNGHEVRLVGTHLDRDVIDSISWRTPRRRSRAPRSP